MSLPGLLGTTAQTIPAVVLYLSADAERLRAWVQARRWPALVQRRKVVTDALAHCMA